MLNKLTVLKDNQIAIIGAGISGLSCAKLLMEKNINLTVFEKDKNLGGLISCSIENGNLFHKVGGHVFNTKYPKVKDWFWKYFDVNKEFKKAKRNSVIYLDKKFIKYPLELNLNQLDESYQRKIVYELIELSCSIGVQKNSEHKYHNFKDFLLNNFGKTLYEIYFKKYNEKIWKRDLEKIPIEWLDGKLPMINPPDILINNISSIKKDDMVHSTFYYPVKGGSQFIVDRLSEGLSVEKSSLKNIQFINNKIIINQKLAFEKLIYTGDIRKLGEILDSSIISKLKIYSILEEIQYMESNGTTTILCECDKNDFSWIYLPDEENKFHRIIMTGNFSKNNNCKNLRKNRISCTIECTGKLSLEEIKKNLGTLPFNIKLIKVNYCSSSYIIQTNKTRSLVSELRSKLKPLNIFLCGRFAEWEYYNMDGAISSAMQICKDI